MNMLMLGELLDDSVFTVRELLMAKSSLSEEQRLCLYIEEAEDEIAQREMWIEDYKRRLEKL